MTAQPTSSPPARALTPEEKHRRSQMYARLTYATIIIVFLSVCAIAVVSTMIMEKNKEGFRAIQVKKPISFIDYTYVDQSHKPAKR